MTDNENIRIIVAGVGGQGVVFASKVLGQAVMEAGHRVVMSEVHGMAQRGGIVTCQICIGDLRSPMIGEGEADVLLSFEPVETYRALDRANSETLIISNRDPLVPVGANLGGPEYPDPKVLFASIKEVNKNLVTLNATDIAIELGSHVMANSVMLGAMAGTGKLPIDSNALKAHLLSKLPPPVQAQNSKAFDAGFAAVSQG